MPRLMPLTDSEPQPKRRRVEEGEENDDEEIEDKETTAMNDLVTLVLSLKRAYTEEVGALREGQEQTDRAVGEIEKALREMQSIFTERLNKQVEVLAKVIGRLNDHVVRGAAGAGAGATTLREPTSGPDPALKRTPAEVQVTRTSTGKKAPKLRLGPRKHAEPFKPANPPPSAMRARRAAARRRRKAAATSTLTPSPSPARSGRVVSPTPSTAPSSEAPLSLPVSRAGTVRRARCYRESVACVPFPDGTFRPYRYHPHEATITLEWAVWKHGLYGQPSVESLDRELGSSWRGDVYGRTWRSRRREIWERIQDMIDHGWTENGAVEEMQRLCDRGTGTVQGLVGLLLEERRKAKRKIKGNGERKSRMDSEETGSDSEPT